MPVALPPCFKCHKSPGQYVSRDGPSSLYCSDCFCRYCVKNFTDAIVHTCELPCDYPVAIAVSGGCHSLFLLYQLGVLRRRYGMRGRGGAVRFILLPFLLREDELVLPPELPATSSSQGEQGGEASTRARDAAASRTRAEMKAQFDLVERQTREQMTSWSFAGEALFEPDELQVFSFSHFIPDSPASGSLATLRAFVHHPQLSLSHREGLYETVKRRVLHLAAGRVAAAWRAREQQSAQRTGSGEEDGGDEDDAARAKYSEETSRTVGANAPSGERRESPRQHEQQQQQRRTPPLPPPPTQTMHERFPWTYLATGEGAELCAASVLESLVRGRGGDSMGSAGGPRSYSLQYATVNLRPLRGLLNKEIVLFLRLQGVAWGYSPSLSTGTSLRSMRRVLEGFVLGLLQGGYRTSVFNILQTASKLAMRPACVAEVNSPVLYDARVRQEEEDANRQGDEGSTTTDPSSGRRDRDGDPHGTSDLQQPRQKQRAESGGDRSSHGPPPPQQQQRPPMKGRKNTGGPLSQHARDRNGNWEPPPILSSPAFASGDSSESRQQRVSVCFVCGAPGCPTPPTQASATGEPSRTTGEVDSLSTMVDLGTLAIPCPTSLDDGEGKQGHADSCGYVCHSCFAFLRDICRPGESFPANVSGRVGSRTADKTALSLSSSSSPSSGAVAIPLLQTLVALSQEADFMFLEQQQQQQATQVRRRGELSEADRAAFLLDEDEE